MTTEPNVNIRDLAIKTILTEAQAIEKLADMIVGLIKPNEGRIFLDDKDITSDPVYRRAQRGIGYLAQEASVFRKLSVEDNIKAVLEMSDLSSAEQRDKLESLLTEFGLIKIRKSLGIQLSGGERRRTEIARALAIDPKFILLDEPFAGVDPIAVEDIQAIVAKLKEKNIGILITDHNVHVKRSLGKFNQIRKSPNFYLTITPLYTINVVGKKMFKRV